MQDRPTFGASSNQGLCQLETQPKIFQKINLERKNPTFWFMEKHLSYNFHIWKNAYHRVFIQFSVRMELYEIVWQEVSHVWKLYDTKFWSTRECMEMFEVVW